MKKKYEAPTAEAVKFEYKDQVVAASGGCQHGYKNVPTISGGSPCSYVEPDYSTQGR